MKKQTYISNDGRRRISPLSLWLIDTGREPLYIEIDDDNERVRVYSVVNIMN